jgi:hypothetical protein
MYILKHVVDDRAARVFPDFRVPAVSLAIALLLIPAALRADEPARVSRDLLALVPPDSGIVLTVDDLRGQVRALLSSRLAGEFQKLPFVKAWFDSEKYEQLENARDQMEGVLQIPLTEIRDQILGDGIVLAVHLPTDGPIDPQRARGILVVKAHDPALLRKLIEGINNIQKGNGEVTALLERKWRETAYVVREFAAGSGRPAEAYVAFPDGTFALSNSEDLVRKAIDRKTGNSGRNPDAGAGSAVMARFQALDRRLPGRALARLFIDAHVVQNLLRNSPDSESPGRKLFERYVGAMESAGAALVVSDGRIAIQTAEVFDSGKFRDLLGEHADQAARAPWAPQLDRLPATALAAGSLQVDFAGLYRFLVRLVPESDQPRLVSFETVLRGVLLGQDLRSRILPGLGPRVMAFVDAPAHWDAKPEPGAAGPAQWPFPTVLAVELMSQADGPPTVAAALENGLETGLALLTLDEKHAHGKARIVSRTVAGVTIKALDPPLPVAFAVDHKGHRLIVGNSADALEHYLQAGSDDSAGARFRRLRELAYPDADSYLCLDLATVAGTIAAHRNALAESIAAREGRSREDVERDLDQVIALGKLFDAAFLTNRIDAASATISHGIGLVARQRGAEAAQP